MITIFSFCSCIVMKFVSNILRHLCCAKRLGPPLLVLCRLVSKCDSRENELVHFMEQLSEKRVTGYYPYRFTEHVFPHAILPLFALSVYIQSHMLSIPPPHVH